MMRKCLVIRTASHWNHASWLCVRLRKMPYRVHKQTAWDVSVNIVRPPLNSTLLTELWSDWLAHHWMLCVAFASNGTNHCNRSILENLQIAGGGGNSSNSKNRIIFKNNEINGFCDWLSNRVNWIYYYIYQCTGRLHTQSIWQITRADDCLVIFSWALSKCVRR